MSGVSQAAIRASCVSPRLDSMEELITAVRPAACAAETCWRTFSRLPVRVGLITTALTPGSATNAKSSSRRLSSQAMAIPVSRANASESARVLQGSSRKAIRSRYAGLTYFANCCAFNGVQARLASRRRRRSGMASSSRFATMPSRTASYSPTLIFATFSPGMAASTAKSSSGSPVQSGAAR